MKGKTRASPGDSARPLRALFSLGSLDGGGAERRLVETLQCLNRERIVPALHLMDRRGPLLKEVPGDIPVTGWRIPGQRQTLAWRALARLAPVGTRQLDLYRQLRRHRADVVIGWLLQSAYDAVRPARAYRIPLVACSVVSPEADLQTAFAHDSQARQRAHWTLRNAACVLVNSVELHKQVRDYYDLPSGQVVAIPSLRDFERIDRLARQFKPPPASTGPRLIAIGRLHPQKGYLDLLAAVAQLRATAFPGCILEILGDGPQREEIRDEAARLQLQEAVSLRGFVENPYPYLVAADVMVHASHYEGLPNVLLEAVALGVPVVSTDCPTGPREILEGGRWGRLTPLGNPGALATAIAETLHHLPQSQETARQAANFVRARHDIHSGVRRFEELLFQVVNGFDRQA